MNDDGDYQGVSIDDLIGAIQHPVRRAVLARVNDSEGPLTVDSLGSDIAAGEGPPGTADAERDVLVSLAHVHLPKLDEADLVDYDHRAGTVLAGCNLASGRGLKWCAEGVTGGIDGRPA